MLPLVLRTWAYYRYAVAGLGNMFMISFAPVSDTPSFIVIRSSHLVV
jgi:hypothetical protein